MIRQSLFHQIKGADTIAARSTRSPQYGLVRFVRRSALFALFAFTFTSACDLIPPKPEDVFVLYRERMTSGDMKSARKLLSQPSRELVNEIAAEYSPDQPPERLALLNVLDPLSPPLVKKADDKSTLLQIRALKGGPRLIRLVKADSDSSWRIDMQEELRHLKRYLQARSVLNRFRNQAGEYAASWRAYQIRLNGLPEDSPESSENTTDDKN